jgi:hypothetical protein
MLILPLKKWSHRAIAGLLAGSGSSGEEPWERVKAWRAQRRRNERKRGDRRPKVSTARGKKWSEGDVSL